jgi:hypothetical protein
VACDCMNQEKVIHGHVLCAVQEVSKPASKGAQNGSYCPGNDHCAGIFQLDETNLTVVTLDVSDPGGKMVAKMVASRRQNRVRQPEDTWPVGFCTYIDVTRSLGR